MCYNPCISCTTKGRDFMFFDKKKMAVTALIMAAVMACPVLADTQTDLDNARAVKAQQEQSLNDMNAVIAQLRKEKDDKEAYLEDLNEQIAALDARLNELSAAIEETEASIAETDEAVREARGDEEDQYDNMKVRIRYMYENSQTSLLSAIIGSRNLPELLNSIEEVRAIEAYDRESLAAFKEARMAVEEKELQLLEKKASLEDLKAEQEEQQAAVRLLADETASQVSAYLAQIDEQAAGAEAMKAEILATQSQIETLVARKAAEEEAARKAAEAEAARIAAEKKAAEEAARKAAEAEEARRAAEEAAAKEAVSQTPAASEDREETLSGSYQYSQSDLELLWAIVAQEDDKSYTGALAVVTCAVNRAARNYGGHGSDPLSQLKAPGQFCYSPSISSSAYWQRRLNGNVPSYVKQAVADCLQNGIRNHNFIYFRSRGAAGRTQIGANWYF